MNVSLRVALASLLFSILMVAATALPAAAGRQTTSPASCGAYRTAAAAQYACPDGGSGITPIRRKS